MLKLDIVLGVIEQNDYYFLQFRNGDPKIGAAGKVGFFGGKVEPKERPIDAVVREISEETNLKPLVKDISFLGKVNVKSDYQNAAVAINAHVFHIKAGRNINIKALEGELVRMNKTDAAHNLDRMTPGTRAVFEEILG